MSLPRELSWMRDAAGLALVQQPIIAPLRMAGTQRQVAPGRGQGSSRSTTIRPSDEPLELQLEFHDPREQVFGVRIYSDREHWTKVGFDRNKSEFYIDRTNAGANPAPGFAVKRPHRLLQAGLMIFT